MKTEFIVAAFIFSEESVIHSTRFEGLVKSSPTTSSRTKSETQIQQTKLIQEHQ